MKSEIATEPRIHDGPVLLAAVVGGINGLHAHVEAQDEIVEVEPDAYSVGHGYLVVELVERELSLGLTAIVAYRPDISGINEERSV